MHSTWKKGGIIITKLRIDFFVNHFDVQMHEFLQYNFSIIHYENCHVSLLYYIGAICPNYFCRLPFLDGG